MENDCFVFSSEQSDTLLRYLKMTREERDRELLVRKTSTPGPVYDAWLNMCRLLEEVIQTMYREELEVLKLEELRRAGLREERVMFDGREYTICGIQENYKHGVPYRSVRLLDKNQNSVTVVKAERVSLKKEDKR